MAMFHQQSQLFSASRSTVKMPHFQMGDIVSGAAAAVDFRPALFWSGLGVVIRELSSTGELVNSQKLTKARKLN
jgi:hypothetical protein